MDTFTEIADKYSLIGKRKELYVAYMKERWSNQEENMSKNGYAGEWAQRFLQGREYQASDCIGQEILDRLDK